VKFGENGCSATIERISFCHPQHERIDLDHKWPKYIENPRLKLRRPAVPALVGILHLKKPVGLVTSYVYAKFYENRTNRLICSRVYTQTQTFCKNIFWNQGTSGIIWNTKSQNRNFARSQYFHYIRILSPQGLERSELGGSVPKPWDPPNSLRSKPRTEYTYIWMKEKRTPRKNKDDNIGSFLLVI